MKRMLVDDLRPEQDPKTKKESMLEVVHKVVAKRQVVGRGGGRGGDGGVVRGDRRREPLPQSTAVKAEREDGSDAESPEEGEDFRDSFDDAHCPKV